MEKGVTLERALEIALESPFHRKTELIGLEDAAGRLLARDLASLSLIHISEPTRPY